jgi:hypothetical protein
MHISMVVDHKQQRIVFSWRILFITWFYFLPAAAYSNANDSHNNDDEVLAISSAFEPG